MPKTVKNTQHASRASDTAADRSPSDPDEKWRRWKHGAVGNMAPLLENKQLENDHLRFRGESHRIKRAHSEVRSAMTESGSFAIATGRLKEEQHTNGR